MKTLYYTATSIDGFIADENHSLEWLFQFPDEDDSSYPEFIKDIGAIVMGSSTYEWILKNHVFAKEEIQPWPYEQPTWVFTSRTLRSLDNPNIHFVNGPVAPVYQTIQKSIAAGKNLWITGGGSVVAQFHESGLLDEFILTIAPVLLQKGAPLFAGRIAYPPLKTLSVTKKKGDFVEIRYQVQKPA